MEAFGLFIFLPWVIHAGIACLPLAFIVPLSRKRVHWEWWESLALILPYGTFVALMFSDLAPKNALNFFEGWLIGVAIPIAALVRVAVGARIKERLCAALLMGLLCIVAVIVYFTCPVVRDSI